MTDIAFTPELILKAYGCGIFPMAASKGAEDVFWVNPERRGVIPLDSFHVSKRLARIVRAGRFRVTVDRDFARVMRGCARRTPRRPDSWINDPILEAYCALHRLGHAHSIEVYGEGDGDGKLVGGLYGVVLGAAFFGESMFSAERDASKVALVHLVARLKAGAFKLLDVQFVTPHLSRFGAVELPRSTYLEQLDEAVDSPATFYPAGFSDGGLSRATPASMQSSTQMS